MSIRRKDYIIYGWKLAYELIDDNGDNVNIASENIEPYLEVQPDGYILIQDWAGSSYTVFGKLVAESEEYGFEFTDLRSEFSVHEAQDKLREILNITTDMYPHTFIFTHSS